MNKVIKDLSEVKKNLYTTQKDTRNQYLTELKKIFPEDTYDLIYNYDYGVQIIIGDHKVCDICTQLKFRENDITFTGLNFSCYGTTMNPEVYRGLILLGKFAEWFLDTENIKRFESVATFFSTQESTETQPLYDEMYKFERELEEIKKNEETQLLAEFNNELVRGLNFSERQKVYYEDKAVIWLTAVRHVSDGKYGKQSFIIKNGEELTDIELTRKQSYEFRDSLFQIYKNNK